VTKAVFFDVDFTLIYPGPAFRGEGYQAFCATHGIDVDPARFEHAVASAAALLDNPDETPYHHSIFVGYTRHIIEQMGGRGEALDACAREIYDEWAACHHFELYEEVPSVLRELASSGVRIGLISNSHRSLDSFQEHFELRDCIAATVSSPDHGLMKPNPSIFNAALQLVSAKPDEAVMVGDSVRQDVEGALRAGLRAVLLHRSESPSPHAGELRQRGVPVIRTLRELPNLLATPAAMPSPVHPSGAGERGTPSGLRRGSY
jgi:putative hydrolase of the HAD superfamily